jgi:transposase
MVARTVSNLPAALHSEPAVCLLAIELSKASWIVAIHTPLADKISRYRLKGCDWKALLELIERIRTRVGEELSRPATVMSCYEASYDGFWLHRLLQAHGVDNHVFDPASLQVNRRARRAKTDRIDAEHLLRALMAYLRGEKQVVSVVRVPNVAEEDARRLHRERDRLINERTQHINRIKGLCATQGIYDYEPGRGDRASDCRSYAPRTDPHCRYGSRPRSSASYSAWSWSQR